MDRLAFLTLAAAPRTVVSVALPDGRTAHVRTITAAELDSIHATPQEDKEAHGFRALYLLHGASDAAGNALFRPSDVPELGKLPFAVVEAMYQAISRLNLPGDATPNPSPGESTAP